MNKIKGYRNTTGTNWMLPNLGPGIGKDGKLGRKGKRISSDATTIHYFSENDIEDCPTLKRLIDDGLFSPVGEQKQAETEESSLVSVVTASEDKDDSNIMSFGSEDVGENGVKFKNNVSKATEIWWTGPATDAGGYGKMNRETLLNLYKKQDLRIHHEPFPIPDVKRSKVRATPELQTMIETAVSDDATSVWAIMPPKFLPRSGYKIVYTMIESNGVSEGFVDKCNNADELWVPSLHNVEVFKNSGYLKIPIYHMPLGVDMDLYRSFELTHDHKKRLNVKTKGFVFFSLFGWSLRKGCDALLRAYLEEFTRKDDVTLMIMSRYWGNASEENIEKIRKDIRDYIKRYSPTSDIPHIVHIGQTLPEEDMPIVFNLADAFVLPSRGEGFGLPGLEAGACRLPVIMTRCTGQLDYLNDDNSYLIDIEGYSADSQEMREIVKISSYYEGQPFAVLGDTAVAQLREKMRHVMNNYSEAKGKAELLYKNIKDHFQWHHLAEKCYDRFKSV